MPSDPRVSGVLRKLAAPIESYRSAVAATLDEVRGYLSAGRAGADASAARLQEQLGCFAGGRIDPVRLAAGIGDRGSLDQGSIDRLQGAADALSELVNQGEALCAVTVPEGGAAAASVAGRLTEIGRAFAAARIASAARAGSSSGLDETVALRGFAHAMWSASERAVAPPLVVTVRGVDLVAGALAPFLDGNQKIVLLVGGACTPAPLVRLITPSVLVVQAHDESDLDALAAWSGTAVAALVPAHAARFVHDPSAGPQTWQRTTVHANGRPPAARIDGFSPWQQAEELRQLESLAAHPPAATAASSSAAVADPAGHLAAWLLQQANLTGPAAGR